MATDGVKGTTTGKEILFGALTKRNSEIKTEDFEKYIQSYFYDDSKGTFASKNADNFVKNFTKYFNLDANDKDLLDTINEVMNFDKDSSLLSEADLNSLREVYTQAESDDKTSKVDVTKFFKGADTSKIQNDNGDYYVVAESSSIDSPQETIDTLSKIFNDIYGVDFWSKQGQEIYNALKADQDNMEFFASDGSNATSSGAKLHLNADLSNILGDTTAESTAAKENTKTDKAQGNTSSKKDTTKTSAVETHIKSAGISQDSDLYKAIQENNLKGNFRARYDSRGIGTYYEYNGCTYDINGKAIENPKGK